MPDSLGDPASADFTWGMLDEYNKLNPKKEPISYEKDPLMKKVAKRLKGEFDYPDKPARKGYPNEPPPKQVDGWHPDYGK